MCRVQGLYRGLYRDNGQKNGNYYLGIIYGCFPELGHFFGVSEIRMIAGDYDGVSLFWATAI